MYCTGDGIIAQKSNMKVWKCHKSLTQQQQQQNGRQQTGRSMSKSEQLLPFYMKLGICIWFFYHLPQFFGLFIFLLMNTVVLFW